MHQTTTLENGLKIITHEQPGIESVYVDIEVSSGSKFSPPGKEGLAHFAEHMVLNGNEKYPTGLDVTRAIKNLGGKMNASTGKESVNYWVKVLHKDLDLAAEVIFPLITSPLLSEKGLDGERKIILEEISRAQDNLERKVSDALFRLFFGEHSLAHPGLGYPESLNIINHTDITSFVKKFHNPKNIVVVASGGLSHDKFVDLVESYFSKISGGQQSEAYSKFKYRRLGPKAVVLTDDSKQARLVLSFPNLPRTSHDHMVERVLSSILHSSDRLDARLREKEHLAYEVGMRRFRTIDLSLPSVFGGFTYSEVAKAVSIICEELERFKKEGTSSEELGRIKKVIEVDLQFGLEAPEGWADFILNWNHFLGDPISPEKFLNELARISAEEVKELARKIFVPDNAYLAVSHREITSNELEEILQKGLS